MNPKLTYLLICIAFLASSCNSEPVDDISLTKGTELSFDVSDITNISRGSVTTSINQFVVYGDRKTSDSASSTVMFDKTKVEYKNDSWCYDNVQYWIPNYEHSFVAISPGTISGFDNNSTYLNSKLSFTYSVPESGIAADILTATHRRLYEGNESDATSDNRITFTFSHLLSLINLAPAFYDNNMGSEECILFHKVKFSGINTQAQIEIKPAQILTGSSTYDMDVNIAVQNPGDYSIVFPTPVTIKNNAENVRLFTYDDAIITLPQEFSADSNAEITLYYTTTEDSDSMTQVSIPLKNMKWESGISYTYKFTLERYGVIFDSCEINPWNEMPPAEITVD